MADSREKTIRPWGSYEVLLEEPGYKVKRIVVNPGCRLSEQRHDRRGEHWTCVEGVGVVTLNGAQRPFSAGDMLEIPVKTAHRLANPGGTPVVLIEVQRGDYLGEDDIVRLQDDYGRA